MRQSLRRLQLKNPKRQQGVVIVVALFIVALVATMAYVMLSRLARDTERTSLILNNVQAEAYAQGSLAWARVQLINNLEQKEKNKITDKTPIKSPENKLNGYTITSTIYDAQARYNLNNLITTDARNDFKRLVQVAIPDLEAEKIDAIIAALTDWLMQVAGLTEYDKYYLKLPIPYHSAHREMISVSELRLVKGVTPEILAALKPYVTTLPGKTNINIINAKAPVLVTLSPSVTPGAAKAIEITKLKQPIQSMEDVKKLTIFKNNGVKDDKISIESKFFMVKTIVSINKQKLVLYTMVERGEDKGKAFVNVLWQSKGVW